ncbi:MAG TPA: hypothetical protein VJ821_01120 [Anaerolineales bacterium]|nr:hypothetical protein [Anaerolineales bacterium]
MPKSNPPQPSQQSLRSKIQARGPLVVSKTNSRYFTVASEDPAEARAVYLTGSHIWNNFHDGMGPGTECSDIPEEFDYNAYLTFLKEHGHNFIRLWRWEQFRSQAAGGGFHLCMTPQPWLRTGPGHAKDGNPKFNLEVFNESYFDRLRERVIAAGEMGIYVAVMLFDGWALHLSPAPDHVVGHPFHAANNVNGIGINSIVDYQVLPLEPRVQAIQEAYIRKVVDTVQHLPNVLYEVANESSGGGSVDKEFAGLLGLDDPPEWGDSTKWQYWVIDVVKRYEQEHGYDKHPIGMTMQFPVPEQTKVNDPLYNSPADWISPGYDDEVFAKGGHPMDPGGPASHWLNDPPAADGRKVVITDTDHYAPGQGDALWAWKSFLRGHYPILMDFGIIAGVNPPDPSAESPGVPSYASSEETRYAMGDTLHYAEKMDLLEMEPRGDLSSTGYVLANPGEEYLILEPGEENNMFSVTLNEGEYTVEWFSVNRRETMAKDNLVIEVERRTDFTSPFTEAGPAVLYLKRIGS